MPWRHTGEEEEDGASLKPPVPKIHRKHPSPYVGNTYPSGETQADQKMPARDVATVNKSANKECKDDVTTKTQQASMFGARKASATKASSTSAANFEKNEAIEQAASRRELRMAPRAGAVAVQASIENSYGKDNAPTTASNPGTSDRVAEAINTPTVLPGAVHVRGINGGGLSVGLSESQNTCGENGQDNTANASEPPPESAISATLVDDDIEAQVQARFREETDDIAAIAWRQLLDKAVVADTMEPNKGPPIEESSCTKRKWIITLVVLVVLGGIGAALGILLGNNDNPSPDPTVPPTTLAPTSRIDLLRDLLEQEFPEAPFDDPNSPQSRALDWLATSDPLQLTEDTATFRQILERYVIVLLYFSANGDRWTNKYGFLSNTTICSWNDGTIGFERQGIFCDSGEDDVPPGTDDFVTHILLVNNNLLGMFLNEITSLQSLVKIDFLSNSLRGPIPESFSQLQQLEFMELETNSMSGTIPSALFELPHLRILSLGYNEITGTIPDNVGNAKRLQQLWIWYCPKLTGSIPESMTQIDTLTALVLEGNRGMNGTVPAFTNPGLSLLDLGENEFTGTIPSTLGSLPDLKILLLNSNFLSGTIPDLAGATSLKSIFFSDNALTGNIERLLSTNNASGLEHLALRGNDLNGTIPTSIGRYTNLAGLWLGQNMFHGSIPTEIGFLTNLEIDLRFFDNQLTGTIPSELGLLTKLNVSFNLGSNKLAGTIPSELGRLVLLPQMSFDSNRLTGTVPTELAALTELETLGFQSNRLTGTVPTELAALTELEALLLAGNDFSGSLDQTFCGFSPPIKTFWADCLGNPPEIECSCCTHCCQSDGICAEM